MVPKIILYVWGTNNNLPTVSNVYLCTSCCSTECMNDLNDHYKLGESLDWIWIEKHFCYLLGCITFNVDQEIRFDHIHSKMLVNWLIYRY